MKKNLTIKNNLIVKALLTFTILSLSPILTFALPVSVELVLLQDISGSMSNSDFNLQRSGYENAFRSDAVLNSIKKYGDIAVTLVYWADNQHVAVDWTHIFDKESANRFADNISKTYRPSNVGFRTGLTDAINMGASLYTDNDFEGLKNVMDVSGDGAESVRGRFNDTNCISCQEARDNALAGNVNTINALWIDDRNYFGDDKEDIVNAVIYGQKNVIGGQGAFSLIADGFEDFESTILTKIQREISPNSSNPVPEPGTILLFGFGLLGIGCVSRKKSNDI